MENNDKLMEAADKKIESLRQEVAELETQVSELKNAAKKASDSLENNLFKQIMILSVFTAVITFILINLIGIDCLGSLGMRGLAKMDIIFVLSVFVLLLEIKFIIIGFKKK